MQTAIFSSEARHSAFGLFGDPEVGQGLLSSDFLLRLLDEIDYGLVLVAADGRICHANHLARHELASARLIATYDECIIGCSAELTAQLQAAIEGAHQGERYRQQDDQGLHPGLRAQVDQQRDDQERDRHHQ